MTDVGGYDNKAENEEDNRQVAKDGEKPHPKTGAQVVDVSGGDWRGSTLGNTTIHKTIIQSQGAYQLSPNILVFERDPINAESRVYRAKLLSEVTGDKDIIVKILPDGERQRREARVHFSVPDHPNIVPRLFIDSFNYRGFPSIYLAMENCDKLNLYQYIEDQNMRKVPFDPSKYLSFARQITKGLGFLHKCNVIHRDLKPPNIVLAENQTVVKICDFGLSKTFTKGKTSVEQTMQTGTVGWKSPEVLQDAETISTSADIFSLALVLYHMLSYGKHPFGDKPISWDHYISENSNLNLRGMKVPNAESAIQMLTSMLNRDPRKRPKAEEVLNHPFFKESSPIQITGKQIRQLTDLTFKKLKGKIARRPMQTGQDETLLSGVEEVSEQLSEGIHQLINDGLLELKPNVRETPPVHAATERVSQFAHQPFKRLAREMAPTTAQPNRAEDLRPEVQEMNERPSEDNSQLSNRSSTKLKPKVGGAASADGGGDIGGSVKMKPNDRGRPLLAGEMSQKLSGDMLQPTRSFERKEKVQAICCFDQVSKCLQLYDPAKGKWTKKQKLHEDMISSGFRFMRNSFTATAMHYNIYVLMRTQRVHLLTHSNAGAEWQPVAHMMFSHGCRPPTVNQHGSLFVIGIGSGSRPSREAERYDPKHDTWTRIPDMKTVKQNHTVAATKGHIYCIGGLDVWGDALASVDRFDPVSQSWSDVAPMKTARYDAASAVLDSKIFVLGGRQAAKRLSDVECYDPDADTWTCVVNMKIERSYFSAVVVNGKIFAVGGDEIITDDAKTIEMFDPEENRWEVIEKVGNMKICSLSAAAIKM